jgi:hypothetical protein
VALAYRASWAHGFLGDGKFLIRDNLFLDQWRYAWGNLSHDYFWSSSGNAIPYWRPLTKLGWLLHAQLLGKEALGFHLVLLGWFALGVVGVQRLARDFGLPAAWSGAAALLYGLHPAAVEAASVVMASSDVICATAVTWALVTGRRWLLGGRWPWGAAHAAFALLALGSKELGVLVAPLLTLWVVLEWWLAPGERPLRAARLPLAWVLVAIYAVLRAAALGESGASGLAPDPLRIFLGLGVYLQGLVPFRLDSGVHSISRAEALSPSTWVLAGAAWLALAVSAWGLMRRRAVAPLLLLAWAVGSLLPVLLVEQLHVPGVAGKFALSDRWLLQAAAASSIFWAMGLAQCARRPAGALAGVVACSAWVLASVALAGESHGFYRDDLAYLEREERGYAATPEAFRTEQDHCRHHDRRAVRAMAGHDLSAAVGAFTSSSR